METTLAPPHRTPLDRRTALNRPLDKCAAFTTGQLARLFAVSAKSVCKWIDSGEIKGFRVGEYDRRVSRPDLVAYCRARGITHVPALIGERDPGPHVALGIDCAVPGKLPAGWARREAGYAAGLLAAATDPAVRLVVVHGSVGLGFARQFAAAVRAHRPDDAPVVVVVVGDDAGAADVSGFDAVMVGNPGAAVDAMWATARARKAGGR